MAQEVWLIGIIVSNRDRAWVWRIKAHVHESEQDEEEQLFDFRPLVLHLEEGGQRDADDHDAGDDVDGVAAEAELRQVDAGARRFGEVGFADRVALEDADDGRGPVVAHDDEGGEVDEHARDAHSLGVGALEELRVDEAEGEFSEEVGRLEDDHVREEELQMVGQRVCLWVIGMVCAPALEPLSSSLTAADLLHVCHSHTRRRLARISY